MIEYECIEIVGDEKVTFTANKVGGGDARCSRFSSASSLCIPVCIEALSQFSHHIRIAFANEETYSFNDTKTFPFSISYFFFVTLYCPYSINGFCLFVAIYKRKRQKGILNANNKNLEGMLNLSLEKPHSAHPTQSHCIRKKEHKFIYPIKNATLYLKLYYKR